MISMLGFGSIIKLIPYDDMRMREVKCMWAVLAIWEGLFFFFALQMVFLGSKNEAYNVGCHMVVPRREREITRIKSSMNIYM